MSDVAREAGVSLKTVSRVVNHEPGVSAETSERVHRAITRLGFRPNPTAQALRQGAPARTLGLVIEDMANPFYLGIMRGVEETVRRHELLLVTASCDESGDRERELAVALCRRRVDGLIVVPAADDHRYLLPEIRLGVRVVFLDRPPCGIHADTVLVDNIGGADAATSHLLEQGHRRVAMVGDLPTLFTCVQRLEGYRRALERYGVAFDESLVRLGRHDVTAAERATKELLALPDPPTAIFASNNRTTIGVLRASTRNGARVALVGFDDFELAELLPVPVTVAAADSVELGRRAAQLLLERFAGADGPAKTVVLRTTLVPRGSGEIEL
jgi:LacI family transcriptional regulator